MKAFFQLGETKAREYLTDELNHLDVSQQLKNNITTLFNSCLLAKYLAPDLEADFRVPDAASLSPKERLRAWIKLYLDGYNNRPSQSHIPDVNVKTNLDPVLEIISASILGQRKGKMGIEFHRKFMVLENFVGACLEEYIAQSIEQTDWIMAWGETLQGVDLCNGRGGVLQIKNRSNSENAQAKVFRKKHEIPNWYRMSASAKKKIFKWETLPKLLGLNDISADEEGFQLFVKQIVNPCSCPSPKLDA